MSLTAGLVECEVNASGCDGFNRARLYGQLILTVKDMHHRFVLYSSTTNGNRQKVGCFEVLKFLL